MRKSLSRIATLTSRNIREIIRDPISIVFTLGLPLVMEVLFYFIFHTLTPQFEMRYLAPGIVVFSQAFLSLFTGLLICLDRSTAFLTRLYVSEARSYEFILSYAAAVMPLALVQSVLFFLVGGILDPSIFGLRMLGCIGLSLFTALLFIGLGILLGSVCNEKSVGGVASVVIAGQSVLSGMWFPTEGLGSGMITAMRCLPFKNATDIMRNALNGVSDTFADFWLPFLIVLAYTLAAFIAAVAAFRAKMNSD